MTSIWLIGCHFSILSRLYSGPHLSFYTNCIVKVCSFFLWNLGVYIFYTSQSGWINLHLCFMFYSLRTSTLSYTVSGMATAWTTMRRKGRRRAVRLMSDPTKPGSWLVWRPNCTTNRDMQRRSRWRRREYRWRKYVCSLKKNGNCIQQSWLVSLQHQNAWTEEYQAEEWW